MADLISIKEFNGLGNKIDPLKNYGYLKSGLNVDVDNSKSIRRRNGFLVPIPYTNITDSYSTKNGKHAYIVDNGVLIHINTGKAIITGITDPVSWADYNGSVFIYSNKVGLIENDKFTSLDHLQYKHPRVTRVNGTQPAGLYQVACSYRNESGREGAISSPTVIEVNENSALSITTVQVSGYEVVIYISPVNGKKLYKALVTTENTVVWDGPQYLLVSPLTDSQLGSSSIPKKGSCIAYHKTRLYLSEYSPSDNKTFIWFSKPYSYHLFDLSHDYIVILGKVNCLISVGEQLIIGVDNAIYSYNETVVQLANYGVPKGYPFGFDEHGNTFLWTHNGVCRLNEFKNLTDEIHKLPTSPEVFSAIIEQNGYGRFVSLLSDKTDAENIFRS